MYILYKDYQISRQEVIDLLIKAGFRSLVADVYMKRADGILTRIAVGHIGAMIEQVIDTTGQQYDTIKNFMENN